MSIKDGKKYEYIESNKKNDDIIEINDEFAKSMGEESLDKLKETIKARIQSDYEMASRMKLKRQLLDALDKEYKFDVPNSLVDAEYKAIVEQYEQAKKYNQLDEEEKMRFIAALQAEIFMRDQIVNSYYTEFTMLAV